MLSKNPSNFPYKFKHFRPVLDIGRVGLPTHFFCFYHWHKFDAIPVLNSRETGCGCANIFRQVPPTPPHLPKHHCQGWLNEPGTNQDGTRARPCFLNSAAVTPAENALCLQVSALLADPPAKRQYTFSPNWNQSYTPFL